MSGKSERSSTRCCAAERTVFGATSVSTIWRCMGHSLELVESNWNRSRALMQSGHLAEHARALATTASALLLASLRSESSLSAPLAADAEPDVELMGVNALLGSNAP